MVRCLGIDVKAAAPSLVALPVGSAFFLLALCGIGTIDERIYFIKLLAQSWWIQQEVYRFEIGGRWKRKCKKMQLDIDMEHNSDKVATARCSEGGRTFLYG